MYGYTQNVTKSNGKVYSYHRRGVLSEHPFLKQGKNCVIIPQEAFSSLKNFFLTGANPTHKWVVKGDWKAVYYLNDKDLDDQSVATAVEELIDRTFVLTTSKEHQKIESELKNLIELQKSSQSIDEAYKKIVLEHAYRITSNPWAKQSVSKSSRLAQFFENYNALKVKQ